MDTDTMFFWLTVVFIVSGFGAITYCGVNSDQLNHEYRMEQLKRDCPGEGE